jgi:hypothetical protein
MKAVAIELQSAVTSEEAPLAAALIALYMRDKELLVSCSAEPNSWACSPCASTEMCRVTAILDSMGVRP